MPTPVRRPLIRRALALLAVAVLLATAGPLATEPSPASAAVADPKASPALAAVAAARRRWVPLPASKAVNEAFVRSLLGGRGDFYRLGILADGFPGRVKEGETIAHPIYGTYVLSGYLRRYAAKPSERLAADMLAFARVAIRRMEPYRGALVFRNPPELGFDRSPGIRYSGLTMSYYALYLAAVARVTGDRAIAAAADGCFRSLLIPEEEGGVLYTWGERDVAIAEIPGRPADLTLNGWLSILVSVHDYGKVADSAAARSIFRRSATTMAELLPLYDVRELRLSRYALSGPLDARLRLSDPRGVVLTGARVVIPGDGAYPLALEGDSRWVTAYATTKLRAVGRDPLAVRPLTATIPLRLVLSRISYPERNVLTVRVTTPRRISIGLDTLAGTFDPRRSSPVDTSWRTAASVTVEPGEHLVKLRIPWDLADSIAPMTNWAHLIEDRPVNIYHAIHVRRLRQMYSYVRISRFASYARIWTQDMCAWASMPAYEGLLTTDDDGVVAPPSVHC